MKISPLWMWLRVIIIIIIIIGGTIIIIILRNPPIPEPPCRACGLNAIKFLGIAEIILAAVSFGLVNKLKNSRGLS
jgi:hypothetical protein